MKNTLIIYEYRDASNYKVSSEELVFKGKLSTAEIQSLLTDYGADQMEGFIPSQVGLPDLQGELMKYDQQDYDEDHCWHYFAEVPLKYQGRH